MPMSPAEKAIQKKRRAELRQIRRARKADAAAALRELTALRKQADKIIAHYKQADARLARRAAILETRLS